MKPTRRAPPPLRDISIERLALDGDGIGHLKEGTPGPGLVAFVPYSLPGDTLNTREIFRKKNHSRWLPTAVKKASPDRIPPQCPLHFQPGKKAPSCGGCNWQMMATPRQQRYKRDLVEETLIRLGGFEAPVVHDTVASPQEWRYRNKVQVPFGRREGRVIAGFYAADSHLIVPFDDCLVQPEASVDMVRFVVDYANKNDWWAYEEDRQRGWLRHLLIRMNEKGEALVTLVTAQPDFPGVNFFIKDFRRAFPQVIGIHQNVQPSATHVILGAKWIRHWGYNELIEEVLDLKLGYEAGSFFQVNTGAAAKLYEMALEGLDPEPDSVVFDVYSGVGALALLAAKRFRYAVGIESVASAVRNAQSNAKRNRIENVEFVEGDAADALRGASAFMKRNNAKKCQVILDPPRAGCDPAVIDALLQLKPDQLVYVSCHPATLARDLKKLSVAYQLEGVVPVDLFPQTAHIESVAVMTRK